MKGPRLTIEQVQTAILDALYVDRSGWLTYHELANETGIAPALIRDELHWLKGRRLIHRRITEPVWQLTDAGAQQVQARRQLHIFDLEA